MYRIDGTFDVEVTVVLKGIPFETDADYSSENPSALESDLRAELNQNIASWQSFDHLSDEAKEYKITLDDVSVKSKNATKEGE